MTTNRETIIIRRATVKDLSSLVTLEESCFPENGYNAATLRQLLDLFAGLIFIAEAEDEAIGYAIGAVEASNNNEAWFLSLGVVENWRRAGVASDLSLAIIEALKAAGARYCRLTVAPNNLAAQGLYSKLGWWVEKCEADYYGAGEERLVLSLDLN